MYILRSWGTKAQMKQSWYIMLNSIHLRSDSPLVFISRREHFPDRRRLLLPTAVAILFLLTPAFRLGKSFGLTVSPFRSWPPSFGGGCVIIIIIFIIKSIVSRTRMPRIPIFYTYFQQVKNILFGLGNFGSCQGHAAFTWVLFLCRFWSDRRICELRIIGAE